MLHCHGAEMSGNAQFLIHQLKPGCGCDLWARQWRDSKAATHPEMDVHDSCLQALPKKIEQVLSMHLNSVQHFPIDFLGTCTIMSIIEV